MTRPDSAPPEKPLTVEVDPFNAETPMPLMARPETPASAFYVRNHFPVPSIDAGSYRLSLKGLFERTGELTLEQIRSEFGPSRTISLFLECAGNGRTTLQPPVPGTPWGFGAAGTATFTGLPLTALLEGVGVKPGVSELVFEGADAGEVPTGRSERYGRSLTPEEAENPDILLAWEMGGRPLTADHGAPLRLIVPGFYGMASVKWLTTITASPEPYQGFYQVGTYRYYGETFNGQRTATPDNAPVGRIRVRSLIAEPSAGATLPKSQPLTVRGIAYSGIASIRCVDLSIDGGETWEPAEVTQPPHADAYQPARFSLTLPAPGREGPLTILSRATDQAGHTQPTQQVWNTHGYGNNIVHAVRIFLE